MLRRALRLAQTHTISFAALLGALVGAAEAVVIEVGGLIHRNSTGVVPLLWSPSLSHHGPSNALQIAFLLLIEVAANILVFAALFAIPTSLVMGIRRLVKGRSELPADPGAPNADGASKGE